MKLTILMILLSCLQISSLMMTSKTPIILNLKRIIPGGVSQVGNQTITLPPRIKKGRSRADFFQEILDLKPGKDFNLNLDKWRAIQSSGLYTNLTATTTVKDDGVALEIQGVENPSIKFAPESSIGGSLEAPEVSFSLAFQDRNFRGLGQAIDFYVTMKEGLDEDLEKAAPSLKFIWRDCTIGRNFRGKLDIENKKTAKALLPQLPLKYFNLILNNDLKDYLRKEFITQSSCSLSFTSLIHQNQEKLLSWNFEPFYLSSTFEDNEDIFEELPSTSNSPSVPSVPVTESSENVAASDSPAPEAVTTSPEIIKTSNEGPLDAFKTKFSRIKTMRDVSVSGAKFEFFRHPLAVGGLRFKAWYETGLTKLSNPPKYGAFGSFHNVNSPGASFSNPFHSVGVECQLPSFRFNLGKLQRKPSTIDKASAEKISKNPQLEGLKNLQNWNFLAKARMTAIKSWGEGLIPATHYRSLRSSQLLRGIPERSKNSVCNSLKTVFGLKTDLYLENIPFSGKVGIFADTALFQQDQNFMKSSMASASAGSPESSCSSPSSMDHSCLWTNSEKSICDFMNSFQSMSSVGASLSIQGLRLDLGFPLQALNKPHLHIGFDFEQ